MRTTETRKSRKKLDKAKKIGGTALGIIVAVGAAIPGVKNILKK